MNELKDDIEVTEEMIEAGADVIFSEPGVADFGISFSGRDLAKKVFLAMLHLTRPE